MFSRRAVSTLSRRAIAARPVVNVTSRSFVASVKRQDPPPEDKKTLKPFDEIKSMDDLLPPGAKPGTIPTDYEQATGLERLEILGKMSGVDIFDMRPLDASRLGTMKDPIVVQSFGEEQYLGCTGFPADSHVVKWLTVSRDRPIERCPECGSTYKMEYIGPADDGHGHDHDHDHGHDGYTIPFEPEPKSFADFVKPEYRYS